MMIKIAENCTNNLSIQQYAFLRIEELLGLTGDIESGGDVAIKRAPYFANDKGEVPPTSFLRGIRSIDQMVQKSAACGYACLLVHLQGDVSTFINWLLDLFKTAVLETILPPLCMIMRKDEARTIFAKAHGVNLLVSQLYKLGVNGNSQQIYELSFCLWTISLSKDIDQQAFLSSGAIRILSDLLASAPSRKVVRMSLAILHNLANLENEDIVTEMLTSGLQRLLESLSKSNAFIQGGDSDMEADVKALSEVLLKNFRELSTFDRWVSEVHSGALRWGVVHTEKFWRENSKLLEADDFKLLKKIISLLHSDDPVSRENLFVNRVV
jgi:V-type H+-transporting ATPase subunit H